MRFLADRAATLQGASRVPVRDSARAPSPFPATGEPFLDLLLWQPANVPEGTRRHFLAVGLNDFPAGVGRQLARWVATGRFDGEDGADYLPLLARVTAPTLALAGNLDVLAPPPDVIRGFDALGSPDKTLRILSPFGGAALDAGHFDILLGARAGREVFDRVAAWLAARR